MSIFNIKFRSRFLNVLGSFVFGSPETLKVSPDFYWLPSDRILPAPGQDSIAAQKGRVYTNRIRLLMLQRAFWIAVGAGTVSFILGVTVTLGSSINPEVNYLLSSIVRSVPFPLMQKMGESEGSQIAYFRREYRETFDRSVKSKGLVAACSEMRSTTAFPDSHFKTTEEKGIQAAAKDAYLRYDCAKFAN